MFLIDKYRNNKYNNIFLDTNLGKIINNLLNPYVGCLNISDDKDYKQLIKSQNIDNFPHLLINGLDSICKDILVDNILEKIFDKSIYDCDEVPYTINGYGNNKVVVNLKQSKYHLLIEPSKSGFDKYLIQDVIKEYSRNQIINFIEKKRDFKVIIIKNIDNLSYNAQASLRRTMETCISHCKFIILCEQLCNVIPPLRSRCLNVRVPLLSSIDILRVVMNISMFENIQLKPMDVKTIMHKSNNKLDKAIWILDMIKFNIKPKEYWQVYITDIITLILSINTKTTSKKLCIILYKIRFLFYEVFITNIDTKKIIKELMHQLISMFDDLSIKNKIIEIISTYEFRLTRGKRHIIHLEACINSLIQLNLYSNIQK
jgi:replication factor C subunit 3/5